MGLQASAHEPTASRGRYATPHKDIRAPRNRGAERLRGRRQRQRSTASQHHCGIASVGHFGRGVQRLHVCRLGRHAADDMVRGRSAAAGHDAQCGRIAVGQPCKSGNVSHRHKRRRLIRAASHEQRLAQSQGQRLGDRDLAARDPFDGYADLSIPEPHFQRQRRLAAIHLHVERDTAAGSGARERWHDIGHTVTGGVVLLFGDRDGQRSVALPATTRTDPDSSSAAPDRQRHACSASRLCRHSVWAIQLP